MTNRRHNILVTGMVCVFLFGSGHLEAQQNMKVDTSKVKQWNDFTQALLDVHKKQITGKNISESKQSGGYAERPEFYLETSYFDAEDRRLLSRIQRETKQPENVHQIELFIYDAKGRVVRDYLSVYLPEFRNAPIATFINFHQYNGDLHSFRQFDASGTHIYEQCKGQYKNEEVFISLDEDQLASGAARKKTVLGSEVYKRCFTGAPDKVGKYIKPEVELEQAQNTETPVLSAAVAREQIERLGVILKKNPKNTNALIKRADLYFQLHRFDESVDDYTAALDINDRLDEAYYGRGMALGRSGQISAGIEDLTVYIKRHPNESHAWTKRGVRYLWKGDDANAQKDLTRAIELDDGNAEAHDDLGVVYARRGEYSIALQHFEKVVKLDPTYQKGFHNLAMTNYLTGRDLLALQAADAALKLQPDARDTLLLKAQILESLGNINDAKRVRDEAEFLPEGNWSEHISIR